MKVKKIARQLAYILYLPIVLLFLLELSYRYYVVDFYWAELDHLNTSASLEKPLEKPAMLVLGDSFTANPNGYIKNLRTAFPEHWIFNSGVSGTCLRQAAIMAPRRIKKLGPEVLLYQIYLGNDLMEFRHPTASSDLSALRKIYWWLSDRIHVLSFLNYRLRHLSNLGQQDLQQKNPPKPSDTFAPESYSARTKMHFRAEPYWIENAVALKNGREKDALRYFKDLKKMLARAPASCKVLVLVIPHCMQVSPLYRERMQSIGARLEKPKKIHAIDYPFFQQLEEAFEGTDVYFINALPFLQEAAMQEPLFYENDPHLNPAGQKILGEYLIEFIKEEAIFDESPDIK